MKSSENKLYKYYKFFYKTKVSWLLIISVITASLLTKAAFTATKDIEITKQFGFNFATYNWGWDAIWRLFTMVIFTNDPPTFYGTLFNFIFLIAYEYYQGIKKLLLIIIIGNIVGTFSGYLVMFKLFDDNNYRDLAISNGAFAVIGALIIYLQGYKKWVLLAGSLTFIFGMLIFSPEYRVDQAAHSGGYFTGMLFQWYFQKRLNYLPE